MILTGKMTSQTKKPGHCNRTQKKVKFWPSLDQTYKPTNLVSLAAATLHAVSLIILHKISNRMVPSARELGGMAPSKQEKRGVVPRVQEGWS